MEDLIVHPAHHDLLILGKFKNLRLYNLLAGRSNAEVAAACGVDDGSFGALLNLQESPDLLNTMEGA